MTYIHDLYILSPTVCTGTNSLVAEVVIGRLHPGSDDGVVFRRHRTQPTAHGASTIRLASWPTDSRMGSCGGTPRQAARRGVTSSTIKPRATSPRKSSTTKRSRA